MSQSRSVLGLSSTSQVTFSCLSSDTTEILELRLLSPAHVQGSLHLPLQPFARITTLYPRRPGSINSLPISFALFPHPPTSSRIHRLLIPTFDRLVLGMRHVRSKPGNRHQAPFFYRRSSYRRKRCERLTRTRHYRGPRKGFHQGVVLPRKHLTPRPKRNGVSAREFLNHTSATISFVAEVGE